MINSFYKYLILHKQASLPGIGNFFIKRIPASVYASANTISSPVVQIGFDKNEGTADKHFYVFLDNEIGEENVNSIRKFNDFSYSLKEELYDKRKISLPDIGQLSLNEEGELIFTEEKLDFNFYPFIKIEKTVDKGTQQKFVEKTVDNKQPKITEPSPVASVENKVVKPNENWWKIALVIAAASLIGILYYYATNNFQ